MGNKPFTLIAALIFLVVAVLHVIRLVKHFHVVLGNHMIPMWVSWLGVIIPLILVWGLWRESRR